MADDTDEDIVMGDANGAQNDEVGSEDDDGDDEMQRRIAESEAKYGVLESSDSEDEEDELTASAKKKARREMRNRRIEEIRRLNSKFEGENYPRPRPLMHIPRSETIAVGEHFKSRSHFELRASEHAARDGKLLMCNGDTVKDKSGVRASGVAPAKRIESLALRSQSSGMQVASHEAFRMLVGRPRRRGSRELDDSRTTRKTTQLKP